MQQVLVGLLQIVPQELSDSKILSTSENLPLQIKLSKTNIDIKRMSLTFRFEDFVAHPFLLHIDKNSSIDTRSCSRTHFLRLQIETMCSIGPSNSKILPSVLFNHSLNDFHVSFNFFSKILIG